MIMVNLTNRYEVIDCYLIARKLKIKSYEKQIVDIFYFSADSNYRCFGRLFSFDKRCEIYS